MRRLLLVIFLTPLFPSASQAATWYATSSSTNINTASLWVPTSTGSCTGSGTALVWGAQANGDVFDANGCTSLAINVDPGAATGASAGVCGTVTVTVTLQTNATNGGGFTYATATNIVIHANITQTKTTALAITGSTGGGTICGNVLGGAQAGQIGVNDSHTSVTVYLVGNATGGTASGAGWESTSAGPLNIVGNATAGSAAAAYGLQMTNNSAAVTMTGNCVGSNTVVAFGCYLSGTGSLTLTGSIINGLKGSGQVGPVIFTPANTGYILYPKDASYTLGVIDTHAVEMPTDPGVANVKSGVVYGSLTGTYSGGGTGVTVSGWSK